MKGLVNGTCDECKQFRPHCAKVVLFLHHNGKMTNFPTGKLVLCEPCRKKLRGKFRIAAQHP